MDLEPEEDVAAFVYGLCRKRLRELEAGNDLRARLLELHIQSVITVYENQRRSRGLGPAFSAADQQTKEQHA